MDAPNPAPPAAPPLTVDPAALRAAGLICRQRDPQWHLASHHLPRSQRVGLFAVTSLLDQLSQILGDNAADNGGGTGGGGDTCTTDAHDPNDRTTPAPPATPPDEPTTGAACESSGACGGESGCDSCGESIPQRAAVCEAVLDHLYRGEATGKPELDMFAPVAKAASLERDLFTRFVQGQADLLELKRCATWRRLRHPQPASDLCAITFDRQPIDHPHAGDGDEHPQPISAAGAAMLAQLQGSMLGSGVALGAVQQAQAIGVGDALRLMRVVYELPGDWRRGQVLLPLDDLVRHRLGERSLRAWFDDGEQPDADAWRALLIDLTGRIDKLLAGGRSLGRWLCEGVSPGVERAWLVMMRANRMRWEQFVDSGGDPHQTPPRLGGWRKARLLLRPAG